MRKVRKKQKNYLKLSEMLKDKISDSTIFKVFQESLDDFCKSFDIINVRIIFIPYTVRVITDNTYAWHKGHHEQLCKYFDLKLVRYNYAQEEDSICVTYTYAAVTDDVMELDFDMI